MDARPSVGVRDAHIGCGAKTLRRASVQATFWVAMAGTANELIAEVDYPDLATFEREGEAQGSDAEWMKVVRSTADFIVQGTGRSELFQTAPQLA